MTTALELMQNVFRRANMEAELSSFSTSQSFPYDIALSVLNHAVDDLNSRGRYRFMETSTALTYSSGVYTYSLETLEVDAEAITSIERRLANYQGKLKALNNTQFRDKYRRSPVQEGVPSHWTDHGDTLELDVEPDQDYSIYVWHYAPISRYSATSDVINIPTRHLYVLENMAYGWLLEALGRQDFPRVYDIALRAANKMKVNDRNLRSRPSVMPRAF